MATEHRLGRAEEYDDYIDFINYVFGFNDTAKNFATLVPYFYRREHHPTERNYLTLEDGKIKGAVCFFRHDLRICEKTLRCSGIGNVAVHPFTREKGYMTELMKRTNDDMIAQDVDIGILGGKRHRYQYFGYVKTGSAFVFQISEAAIRQSFGDRSSALTICDIKETDTETLDRIAADIERQPCSAVRKREDLYEILTGWHYRALRIAKDGEYRGFAILDQNKTRIIEIVLADPATDLDDFLIAAYHLLGDSSFELRLPPHQRAYIQALMPRMETYTVQPIRSFLILNYQRVIDAFLKLKLTYTAIPDGELCLCIHGYSKTEHLRISVQNGIPSVRECAPEDCTIELEHVEATQLLFSPLYPSLDTMPCFARLLFPLPIWVFPADYV